MPVDQELLKRVAREILGWSPSDTASLVKTARRLEGLLAQVRSHAPLVAQAGAPAFCLKPGAGRPAPQPTAKAGAPAPPAGTHFLDWPAGALAQAMRDRQLSPTEVTRAALERIGARDGALGAFVTVLAEEAMAQARLLEREAPRGPLYGVPVALKDMYEVAGVRTTAGSAHLAEYISTVDSAVARRLKQAGAVLVGKTATHEFAYGTTTDSAFHGPVRNPLDPARSPGGSSGGSGAAVGAGLVPLAMGTDTAGSVRIPAACCGVVGLKPTYGQVSTDGILPLSWSLDHAGPIARNVNDAALALGVIIGGEANGPAPSIKPSRDLPHATPVSAAIHSCALSVSTAVTTSAGALAGAAFSCQGLRIGLPEAWLTGPLDPAVASAFDSGLDRLRNLGAIITPVTLPPLALFHFISTIITLAEASSYHTSRWPDAQYGADVAARIELGRFISAADYLMAQRLRGEVCRQVQQVMAEVDLLVTPAMPILPPVIGQRLHTYPDGRQEPAAEAMLRFVSPFNVTGQPAIVLPCGQTEQGLSVSIQLVGPAFGDAVVLQVAAAFENAGAL